MLYNAGIKNSKIFHDEKFPLFESNFGTKAHTANIKLINRVCHSKQDFHNCSKSLSNPKGNNDNAKMTNNYKKPKDHPWVKWERNSMRPKPGFGIRNRNQGLISLLVSEQNFFFFSKFQIFLGFLAS